MADRKPLRECPYCGEQSRKLPYHIRWECDYIPATDDVLTT